MCWPGACIPLEPWSFGPDEKFQVPVSRKCPLYERQSTSVLDLSIHSLLFSRNPSQLLQWIVYSNSSWGERVWIACKKFDSQRNSKKSEWIEIAFATRFYQSNTLSSSEVRLGLGTFRKIKSWDLFPTRHELIRHARSWKTKSQLEPFAWWFRALAILSLFRQVWLQKAAISIVISSLRENSYNVLVRNDMIDTNFLSCRELRRFSID